MLRAKPRTGLVVRLSDMETEPSIGSGLDRQAPSAIKLHEIYAFYFLE